MATLYELSEAYARLMEVEDPDGFATALEQLGDEAGALKVLNAVVSPTSTLHHTAPSVWEDRRY